MSQTKTLDGNCGLLTTAYFEKSFVTLTEKASLICNTPLAEKPGKNYFNCVKLNSPIGVPLALIPLSFESLAHYHRKPCLHVTSAVMCAPNFMTCIYLFILNCDWNYTSRLCEYNLSNISKQNWTWRKIARIWNSCFGRATSSVPLFEFW